MQDEIIKSGKWEFDEDVTRVFDNMLSRSIPDYGTMRDLIHRIGRGFVGSSGTVFDIGCSRGESFRAFAEDGANVIGLEISEPMIKAAREVYRDFENVSIQKMDLRKEYPEGESDLTLSILTLQFTPIEYRYDIMRRVFQHIKKGGAFILCEKVIGNSADIDQILIDAYYSIKAENRYTQDQIESKRKSLEGVLVPLTAKWNEEMLYNTGFASVDCFWRNCNFAAWIALKK